MAQRRIFTAGARARLQPICIDGIRIGTDRVPIITRMASRDRNKPCPCGSGKKLKKCCGSPNPPRITRMDDHDAHLGATTKAS